MQKVKDIFIIVGIIALLIILIYKKDGSTTNNEIIKSDTARTFAPGVVKEITTNNPVPYEVNHYHDSVIVQRMDTSMLRQIVYDYLSTRLYKDSLKFGDTATFYFDGMVEKNQLIKHKLRGNIHIPIVTVTNTKNVYRNSLFVGAGPGYNNQRLTGAIYGGIETKQMQFGVAVDPFYKSSYIFVSKRINFKK